MKIIVTGSLGNISKPLTQQLVAQNHDVTVISHSDKRESEIRNLGAKAAIGSISDENFLVDTFLGADVVYLMIPSDYKTHDMTADIASTGATYAAAIEKSGVKRIVVLSSMGAHLPTGNGPLSALGLAEKNYEKLQGVDITYLRPGFFYTNYLAQIGLVNNAGILGDNTSPNTRFLLTHPADIAEVAADVILNPTTRKSLRFIVSDELNNTQIASLLGKSIKKPDLTWVQFSNEDYKNGLMQNGFSESAARAYVEMGEAFLDGRAYDEVDTNQDKIVKGKRRFEDFAAEVFAPAFSR
ncbi:NmrA family NAD(P)-binding protein [Flavobacterium selenitireducens]|uniref:NmrA family NAD(P)-binding protein n=1 Tax=Flavobacterium selenitireducens TaxID=2722704 RepID=UPI00168ABD60|nr:NmrA family NAD(P)-binding protein [Flavobacterium selenitireducens]MBD3581641.1 NAD(P)H-binding protein [Flavobacterium selenitireducens]